MAEVVTVHRDDGVVLARCHGEIDLAVEDPLRASLRALPAPGVHVAVVDLSAVTFMSCAGINVLVAAARSCERAGVRVLLAAVPPMLLRSLRLLRLTEVFVIVESTADAVTLARAWVEVEERPAAPTGPNPDPVRRAARGGG